jgi:hypothetical protein
MFYCPYSDEVLADDDGSSEHILPLALGGMNGIELPVSRVFNSALGSQLDGAMANDFLTIMKRNQHDVRGHSGKRPVFVAKKAFDAESKAPLQLHLDRRDGLKAWNPITKDFMSKETPKTIAFNFTLDLDLELRFVAKVALASGYFVYGERFRSKVKHAHLRSMMNTKPQDMGDSIFKIEAHVDTRWTKTENIRLMALRKICQAVAPSSIIGLVPSKAGLAIFVGILGEYIGMISTPADTAGFPNEGEFDWGHVITFDRSAGPRRASFREHVKPLADPQGWL